MRGSSESSSNCDHHHLARTQSILQAWATRDPAAAKTGAMELRQTLAEANWDTVERHGGFDVVMEKIVQWD